MRSDAASESSYLEEFNLDLTKYPEELKKLNIDPNSKIIKIEKGERCM